LHPRIGLFAGRQLRQLPGERDGRSTNFPRFSALLDWVVVQMATHLQGGEQAFSLLAVGIQAIFKRLSDFQPMVE
jgi:hypothetical protein